MCQTAIISKHIGRIGRRSFDRRLRLASPMYMERRGELARLLNDVDRLSYLLHEEFSTITAEDYHLFGSELKIVINTLKALRQESLSHNELSPYNDRMRQQISDLEEIDHDIKTFRVNAPMNENLRQTMATIGALDFSRIL